MTRRSPYPDPNVEALRCENSTSCPNDDHLWHTCDRCDDSVCESHGEEIDIDNDVPGATGWLCQNCQDTDRSPDYDTF